MTHDTQPDLAPSTADKPASDPMPREKAKGFGQFRGSVSNNALFGVSDDLPRVIEVELDRIQTNPDQPRKHFDPDKLQELADSIREHGLIQPISVADGQTPGTYLVVAGERRLRAHQLLERPTIAAILTTGDPDVLALIENIQREAARPARRGRRLRADDRTARLLARGAWPRRRQEAEHDQRSPVASQPLPRPRLGVSDVR